MALRTKTIEFAYPYATASVAAGTARNFSTTTLFIPENIGVSKTIDTTAASGNLITFTTDHNLKIGNRIVPSTSGGGLTSGTTYWVLTVPSSTTITVSASFNGAAQTLTDSTTDITVTAYNILFQSVTLEISVADNVTAATSSTSALLGIGLGAVAVDTATVTQTLTNSGENNTYIFTREVSSYFNSNWTANVTNMNSTCRLTMGGVVTINASAKIIITYEYEDSVATTRIKTVKIPIDGNTGNLTTNAANIGAANQLPNLSTFLPEDSKTFRNIFFESYTHTNVDPGGGTSGSYVLNFNGVGDVSSTAFNNTLGSDVSLKRIDQIQNLFNTNAQSSVTAFMSANDRGGFFPCLCGLLVVTYEYDHSTSTSIMNSLEIPIVSDSGAQSGTTDANRSLFRTQFFVLEPATITLVQSGFLLSTLDGGLVSTLVAAGSQAYRTYNLSVLNNAGNPQRSGSMFLGRRIDSGETGGVAGMTLARGLNTIDIEYYNTSTTSGGQGVGTSVMLYLNYTSGKHSDGDGAHAHTVKYCNRQYTTIPTFQRVQYTPIKVPSIPETNYHIISTGFEVINIASTTTVSNFGFTLRNQYSVSEGLTAGWKDLYTMLYNNIDSEAGTHISWLKIEDCYKSYPTDPDTFKLDIQTSRNNQLNFANLNQFIMLNQYVTYNSITYTISGTISGSNGGTVTIEAYRTDNNKLIATTSRVGNGSYSMTWYDNTIPVFVFAYESSTYKGVSVEQVAGNTFDISLSSGGAGGPTYYSYV